MREKVYKRETPDTYYYRYGSYISMAPRLSVTELFWLLWSQKDQIYACSNSYNPLYHAVTTILSFISSLNFVFYFAGFKSPLCFSLFGCCCWWCWLRGRGTQENWVEIYRQGVQTLTLFKPKIAHFATLLNTGNLNLKPLFLSFCKQFRNSSN